MNEGQWVMGKEIDKMDMKISGEEKAAILMTSINKNLAAQVFKNLKDEDIHRLTYFMTTYKPIPSQTKTEILTEFYQLFLTRGYVTGGGIEYARDILTEAL